MHRLDGIKLPRDMYISASSHENPHLQIESLLLYLVPTNCSIRSLRPGMISNIRYMEFKISNGADTRIGAPITKQIHAVVD